MKTFLLWVENVDYDEYDSCVIVAEDEAQVRAMMRHSDESYCPHTTIGEGENCVFFGDHQGEIHIKEVDMTRPHVVCASFNAG